MSGSNRIDWFHAIGQSEFDPTKAVDRTTKAVGWAIGAHMNAAGRAVLSQPRIAQYASCSVSTVKRAVVRLETNGFLRVERPSRRAAHHYYATVPSGFTLMTRLGGRQSVHNEVPVSSNHRPSEVTQMSYEMKEMKEMGICIKCKTNKTVHEDAALCADCITAQPKTKVRAA